MTIHPSHRVLRAAFPPIGPNDARATAGHLFRQSQAGDDRLIVYQTVPAYVQVNPCSVPLRCQESTVVRGGL